MLWSAIVGGPKVLAFWQVWLVAIAAALVIIAFQAVIMGLASRGGERTQAAGCLVTMLGGTVVQAIVNSILFAAVLPIVLGGNRLLPFDTIAGSLGLLAKVGIAGTVAGYVVALIPGIGRMTALVSFVQGVVICRLLVGGLLEQAAARSGRALEYPGVLASVAFLAIAWGLSLVVITVVAGVAAVGSPETAEGGSEPGLLTLPLLQGAGILAGCLPVFMYMRYAFLGLSGTSAP